VRVAETQLFVASLDAIDGTPILNLKRRDERVLLRELVRQLAQVCKRSRPSLRRSSASCGAERTLVAAVSACRKMSADFHRCTNDTYKGQLPSFVRGETIAPA